LQALFAALQAPTVTAQVAVDLSQSDLTLQYGAPLVVLPREQTPQSLSRRQAVVLSGQTLPQSAAFVHDFVPIAQLPPVVCRGQSVATLHCWVVGLPNASWHSAYAAQGVDVLEQVLVP
jgi:hypothetical protein